MTSQLMSFSHESSSDAQFVLKPAVLDMCSTENYNIFDYFIFVFNQVSAGKGWKTQGQLHNN